jgi:hypothetical protein
MSCLLSHSSELIYYIGIVESNDRVAVNDHWEALGRKRLIYVFKYITPTTKMYLYVYSNIRFHIGNDRSFWKISQHFDRGKMQR